MALTILKVEPADQFGNVIGSAITQVPEPTAYTWSKMDISGQEAGRRLTSDMWKNLKAKARTHELSWSNRNADVASVVNRYILGLIDIYGVEIVIFRII